MEEAQIQWWHSTNSTRSHKGRSLKNNFSSTNQEKSIHIAKIVCTSTGASVYQLLAHAPVLIARKKLTFVLCTPSQEPCVLQMANYSNHSTSIETTWVSGSVEFHSSMLTAPHVITAGYTTTTKWKAYPQPFWMKPQTSLIWSQALTNCYGMWLKGNQEPVWQQVHRPQHCPGQPVS